MKKIFDKIQNLNVLQIIGLLIFITVCFFLFNHDKYCLDKKTGDETIEKVCFKTIQELNKEKKEWELENYNKEEFSSLFNISWESNGSLAGSSS